MKTSLPRRTRKAIAGLAALSLAAVLGPVTASAGSAADDAAAAGHGPAALPDLIISEYIEGSGNNKAVEIYNGTGADVDLTGYRVQQYTNGSSTPGNTINLAGTVADGDVFVVAHSMWALDYTPDQLGGGLNFNGNDALVLLDGEVVIDSFGRVGEDPGAGGWGTPPNNTTDRTLVRNADVCAGDTVIDDAFEPTVEWTVFAQNTITDLGQHTAECGPAGPQEPVINEFSADTVGNPDVEFLEVFADPGTDLSHLTILQVEGDAESSQRGRAITAHPVGSTDEAAFWLVDLPNGALQNGTLTLLLVSDFTGTVPVTLDSDQDGTLDDDLPFTEILDSVAVDDGGAGDLTYSSAVLSPGYDGYPEKVGGASRIPNGVDTDTAGDWMRNAFNPEGTPRDGEAWNTPGEPNLAYQAEPLPPGGECGDPATPIGTVQGEGFSTPIPGETVTVEAIVIGDFQHTGSFGGFYVQDGGDDNPATSDGIWVPSTTAVDEGDLVRVTGVAGETFGLTQIVPGTVLVCASDAELPEPVQLTLPLTDQEKEAHESMRVVFTQDLAILEYFNYGRFGEIVIGVDRQFQPTATYEPGSDEAVALLAANLAERITLDDGLNIQNPSVTRHPNGEPFALDNYFRGGDLVGNATGVLDFRFGLWRIQPTAPADFMPANERPEVPDVGGDTTVASFNVLNYFTTLGSRGAVNPEEFERQEIKIVVALAELDADVVGLIEIENNDDVALATLTEALNDYLEDEVYDYLATGVIGTDEITTAYIYKADVVEPVGDFALLTEEDDERFLDQYNRPVLAQTFQRLDGGEPVTVANNHLKSKGSGCEAVGDPEDPNGQGNCNGVRTAAAEAMVDWLATDPTGTDAENILIIGDLNSYDKEDPIVALQEGGYTDLLYDYQGEFAYTYVFDGQLGYLDYALASESAAERVTGAAAWLINADEASLLDYTTRFKPPGQAEIWAPDAFRSSDHDPVLVGLDLLEEPVDPVDPVDRIFGDDRYQTAAAIAAEFGEVDMVFLASGQEYPDALAAAPPAVDQLAPVLLTRAPGLPIATRAALAAASPNLVVVLGGPDRVSDVVIGQVEQLTGAEVVRIAGDHRYQTAALVAELYDPDQVDTVYVASGENFADALAGAPLAGIEGSPILLTRDTLLPSATRAALTDLAPSRIVLLGSEARVNDDVYLALQDYAEDVERLAGGDRYGTARLIAERLPDSDHVIVANGLRFADALSGAPLAGALGAPIVLTRADLLPSDSRQAIIQRDPDWATLLGDENSVGEAVEDAVRALLTP